MSRNPAADLAAALRMAIANIGTFRGAIAVRALRCEPWASATFAGARLHLRVAFDGPGAVGAAADVLARLDDLDVALPGRILADLTLLADARRDDGAYARLDLEALTIEE